MRCVRVETSEHLAVRGPIGASLRYNNSSATTTARPQQQEVTSRGKPTIQEQLGHNNYGSATTTRARPQQQLGHNNSSATTTARPQEQLGHNNRRSPPGASLRYKSSSATTTRARPQQQLGHNISSATTTTTTARPQQQATSDPRAASNETKSDGGRCGSCHGSGAAVKTCHVENTSEFLAGTSPHLSADFGGFRRISANFG